MRKASWNFLKRPSVIHRALATPAVLAGRHSIATVGRLIAAVSVGFVALAMPNTVSAQTATCISAQDSSSLDLRGFLRNLVTSQAEGAKAVRSGSGLVTMDSTKVVVLTDQRKCNSILAGVNAALHTPNQSRQMYVYTLGKDFGVYPRGVTTKEGAFVVFLDSKYALRNIVLAFIRP